MPSDLPADIREARAGEPDAGKRLDRFLSAAFPELSRLRLQALIAQGAVTHDAATIGDANKRVKPGELYRLHVPAAVPAEPQPENIPLVIVHEDPELIGVDTPAGLVVQPAGG